MTRNQSDLLSADFSKLTMEERHSSYRLKTGRDAISRGRTTEIYKTWESKKIDSLESDSNSLISPSKRNNERYKHQSFEQVQDIMMKRRYGTTREDRKSVMNSQRLYEEKEKERHNWDINVENLMTYLK